MTERATCESCEQRPATLNLYFGADPTPFSVCDSCDVPPAATDHDALFPEPARQNWGGAWSR